MTSTSHKEPSGGAHWIVSQLGAREHYAVARAIHQQGRLFALVTETWSAPGSIWRLSSPRVADRYHPALSSCLVKSFNGATAWFEVAARAWKQSGWPLILSRNEWFQHRATKELAELEAEADDRPVLFAYSYAARRLFEWAKARGWKTVLGQIDGGIEEERLIQALRSSFALLAQPSSSPPSGYWASWRRECELADRIVVNSEWSRSLLETAGVPASKMAVIPLAYEGHSRASGMQRSYPEKFDTARPLRVLFLGQVGIRKGALELLAAARMSAGQPIEFWMVGPEVDPGVSKQSGIDSVKWFGAVPRSETSRFYADADVFLFPTHSDGFGLTQLEAMAHGLPIIASRYCGEVVCDGVNGHLLTHLSAEAIRDVLLSLVADPRTLAAWARNASVADKFTIESVGRQFLSL